MRILAVPFLGLTILALSTTGCDKGKAPPSAKPDMSEVVLEVPGMT